MRLYRAPWIIFDRIISFVVFGGLGVFFLVVPRYNCQEESSTFRRHGNELNSSETGDQKGDHMSETNTTQQPKSKLEALMTTQLAVTGADIPEGSYPGTLFEFSEPWEMDNKQSKFYRPGQPEKKVVFEASFAIFDKAGAIQRLEYLLPWPDGGAANRRSNLYKMLGKLANGTKLIREDGAFAQGTTLASFLGLTGILQVKKNAKDFPNIESLAARIDGLKYPSLEDCKGLDKIDNAGDVIPF